MSTPRISALFAALLFFVSAASWAGSITLQWDPVTDPVAAGYQIFYGTKTATYGTPIDVPGDATVKTYTVNGLTAGVTYYFVARARNAAKTLFSAYSNEVSGAAPLEAPGSLKIVITISN